MQAIFCGLFYGGVALAGIIHSELLNPAVKLDGSTILISTAGFFFGPVTALISTMATILFRICINDRNMLMGSLMSIISALWGILFFYRRKFTYGYQTVWILFLFGLLVHFSAIIVFSIFNFYAGVNPVDHLPMMLMSLLFYSLATALIAYIYQLVSSHEVIARNAHQTESMYRFLMNASPDAIIITNQQGIVEMISQITLPMFRCNHKGDIIGEAFEKFIVPEERQKIRENMLQMHQGFFSGPEEYEALCCDGTVLNIEINGKYIPEGIDLPSRVVFIVRDITEKTRIERQLLQLNEELEDRVKIRTLELENINKALKAFSHSVSHDLRAPLRAIHGFSDVLKLNYSEVLGEEGRRMLNIIIDNAQRMDELINGLLFMSKVTQSDIKKTPMDMHQMVKSCLDELIQDHELVSVDIGSLPEAYGDPVLIRQVWINLIGNALKFSRGRDKISIKIDGVQKAKVTEYAIRDNGVGFDEKYKDKLFDTFQRLHRDSEFEGTGIGLALVERIIHRHGGRIWAESELDKGARFFFTLPLKK